MSLKRYKECEGKPSTARVACKTDCGPGLTKQEFREEVDVNNIMKRYGATGQLPVSMSGAAPFFADVTNLRGGFADMLNRVRAAETAFMSLPPEIRSRFANRPERLVEFLEDPKNLEEAVELGLMVAPKGAKKKEPKAPKEAKAGEVTEPKGSVEAEKPE